MTMTLKRYFPTGETRALWDDAQAGRERDGGAIPRRASHVLVVEDGPHRGRFAVDFSPLAALCDDPALAVCLPATFAAYGDAVRAEVAWLQGHWVLAGLDRGAAPCS